MNDMCPGSKNDPSPYDNCNNENPSKISLAAHAKVNISLVVFAKRSDGFHQLHTIMAPVGLSDQLTISKSDKPGITLKCSDSTIPDGPENLVYKAITVLENHIGRKLPVKIELQKRIPSGAGLGGASADAAICMLAVNKLFNLGLTLENLSQLCAKLGSDVPFFLFGSPAICTGRGEIVEPLPLKISRHIMLVMPGIHVPTPLVYKNYKHNENITTEYMKTVEASLQKNNLDQLITLGINSLTDVTMSLFAPLSNLRDELERLGIGPIFMSGSGSTLFVTSENVDQLMLWQKLIEKNKLANVCITDFAR